MNVFSRKSRERLEKVKPEIAKVMIEAKKDSPINFEISVGIRTQAEQDELFKQGRTKPGRIVTWTLDSNHKTGHAVDVVIIGPDGNADWTEAHYEDLSKHICAVAEKLGIALIWGGTFKDRHGKPRPDRPHYELNRTIYK